MTKCISAVLPMALLIGCAPPTALVLEGRSWTYREEPTLVGRKLGAIQFGYDSDRLDDRSRTALAGVAGQLRKRPEATVRIEGNCDPRGAREYNQALGLRRAQAAKRFLVASGVINSQLATVSFGADRAARDQTNEE